MNKVASELYSILSMYPESYPLPVSVLNMLQNFLDDIQPKLKTVWQNLKEHNITIPEKRGYSLTDMAAGKLPKNYGQAMTFVEIVQMIIEAAEIARNKINGKEND